MFDMWVQTPGPSELDATATREITRIEQAALQGDDPLLELEYRGLQRRLKRIVKRTTVIVIDIT